MSTNFSAVSSNAKYRSLQMVSIYSHFLRVGRTLTTRRRYTHHRDGGDYTTFDHLPRQSFSHPFGSEVRNSWPIGNSFHEKPHGPNENKIRPVGDVANCFHFILHSFNFVLGPQRPTVGFIVWLGHASPVSPIPAENELRNATEQDRANDCYVTNPLPPGRPKRQ